MKKLFYFFAMAAIIIGCSKEETIPSLGKYTITGHSSVQTKTDFGTTMPKAENYPTADKSVCLFCSSTMEVVEFSKTSQEWNALHIGILWFRASIQQRQKVLPSNAIADIRP
jgi:hypothetical protein